MSLIPYALTRPLLFGMDAEAAHELTMDMLARGQRTPLQWAWASPRVSDPIELAGLQYPNRVGLAAGLDKNARCIDALGAIAKKALKKGTGARGLRSIVEEAMLDIMFELPDQPEGTSYVIDGDVIDGRKKLFNTTTPAAA